MFEDLRGFLDELAVRNRLAKVEAVVNPDVELGAVCRENFNRLGPALLFTNVKGFKTPVVVGVLGTREQYSIALGCEANLSEISKCWQRAYDNPIKAEEISEADAPCKQNKITDINLHADPFPIPRWHPLDAGPELGTLHGVITADPHTNWTNMGTYRNQVLERDILGCLVPDYKHIAYHWREWKKICKPMPVAIALGLDPYLTMS